MARKRIPVLIVAGFLGSGKTTLLNHLLTNDQGARIGVIMNDFGAIGVDAMSVAGQVDAMVSLSNGCLCCAVDASGLDAMLGKLSEPKANIDVIVIEASGLAEPRDLIRLMIASENQAITYGGLIEVVDAAEFDETRTRHPELDQHLRFADLVLLNKTDRVPEPEQKRLTALLTELAPGTPVLATEFGRIDPELFFDPEPGPKTGQLSFDDLRHEHADHSEHIHAAYESVEFVSERPLNPRRLVKFLEARPHGLYRIKGFIDFGPSAERQKFAMQSVGAFLRFERTRWARDEQRRTELVLIGAGIDSKAVHADLTACVENDQAEADERGMLLVLRHTES
ncbi:GTP-binding protein [Amycolatopsis sp. cg5]|uniref:CobW family GTP-binding protein n=1 Tax=Amycolatopsis sp. cg5 TaxID=3238802 RepID=UPI0035252F4F